MGVPRPGWNKLGAEGEGFQHLSALGPSTAIPKNSKDVGSAHRLFLRLQSGTTRQGSSPAGHVTQLLDAADNLFDSLHEVHFEHEVNAIGTTAPAISYLQAKI
jgi:hypothetical protein